MLDSVSPLRPRVPGKEKEADRTKPVEPPPNDDFRKRMRDRQPKKQQEYASVEDTDSDLDSKPSLFDLSKNKAKNKSALTKTQSSLTEREDSSLSPLSSESEREFALAYEGNDEASSSLDSPLSEPDQEFAVADEDLNIPIKGNIPETIPKTPTSFTPKTKDHLLTAGEENLVPTDPTDSKKAQFLQNQELGKNKQHVNLAKSTEVTGQQAGLLSEHPHKLKRSVESPEFVSQDLEVGKKNKTKSSSRLEADIAQEKGMATQPALQSIDFEIDTPQDNTAAARSATIRELAAQIVDRIQVMRRDNETQTMITLRHPPILEGATITLTTSDQTKGEFNISFANLTSKAKVFLDQQLKENPLSDSLERKGIVVHTITTTTQAESLVATDASQSFRDRQEQQQQQQQQQQRRREEEGKEEKMT